MRRPILIVVCLVIAVCLIIAAGGCTASSSNSSASELEDDSRAFISDFLSGKGEAVYARWSERCKRTQPLDAVKAVVDRTPALYGNARLHELKATVDGNKGKVTQRFDTTALDEVDEPWVFENDEWHWDDCG